MSTFPIYILICILYLFQQKQGKLSLEGAPYTGSQYITKLESKILNFSYTDNNVLERQIEDYLNYNIFIPFPYKIRQVPNNQFTYNNTALTLGNDYILKFNNDTNEIFYDYFNEEQKNISNTSSPIFSCLFNNKNVSQTVVQQLKSSEDLPKPSISVIIPYETFNFILYTDTNDLFVMIYHNYNSNVIKTIDTYFTEPSKIFSQKKFKKLYYSNDFLMAVTDTELAIFQFYITKNGDLRIFNYFIIDNSKFQIPLDDIKTVKIGFGGNIIYMGVINTEKSGIIFLNRINTTSPYEKKEFFTYIDSQTQQIIKIVANDIVMDSFNAYVAIKDVGLLSFNLKNLSFNSDIVYKHPKIDKLDLYSYAESSYYSLGLFIDNSDPDTGEFFIELLNNYVYANSSYLINKIFYSDKDLKGKLHLNVLTDTFGDKTFFIDKTKNVIYVINRKVPNIANVVDYKIDLNWILKRVPNVTDYSINLLGKITVEDNGYNLLINTGTKSTDKSFIIGNFTYNDDNYKYDCTFTKPGNYSLISRQANKRLYTKDYNISANLTNMTLYLKNKEHNNISEGSNAWIWIVVAIIIVAILGGGTYYWHRKRQQLLQNAYNLV
jgi:hypothetical protein